MANKKKRYHLRWNRILFFLLIPVVCVFLIYFYFFHDSLDKRLEKLEYSEEEITFIHEKLSKEDTKKLTSYSYLSFLMDLVETENYDTEKLTLYIDYILSIEEEYALDSVVLIVNYGIDKEYSSKLASLVKEEYFLLSRLERYLDYDSDDSKKTVTEVNSNLDYEFYTNIQKTDLSKETLLIVNKYYSLESDYYYGKLVTMEAKYDNKKGSQLSSVAYEAFKKLVDAALEEGYYIRNNSAYRSYSTQQGLYNNYKNNNGLVWADKWSARPGHSEHQTGLALDVGAKSELLLGQFEFSREFTWMKENCAEYGFILRYPKGKEYITGYGYEPWHYRYVGVEAATYIMEHDITYEEYYAYFVEKN